MTGCFRVSNLVSRMAAEGRKDEFASERTGHSLGDACGLPRSSAGRWVADWFLQYS